MWLLAFGTSAAPAALVAQATSGIITGRITERASGQPLVAAQVQVVGTNRGAATAENGSFRIAGVPAGTYQLRVLRIGFQAQTLPVTVTAGGTANVTAALATSTVSLDAVTVTATGTQQRAREQGSNIAQVSVQQQPLAAVTNFGNLLAGRAAGVTVVQSSGTTGTGSRVRIRGANSVNQSNEPLLIIDGVRIDPSANSGSIGVGGQTISRLNDLKPEDIETFEILKGPAATGLYGTQAANGVIQVTTRRGSAGRAQWNAFGDLGTIRNFVNLPGNWTAYGRGTTGATAGQPLTQAGRNPGNSGTACALFNVAAGSCVVDSLTARSPLNVSGVSPVAVGNRNRIGGSVRGGNEVARYFLSSDGETEHGALRGNSLTRRNYRANLDATPTAGLNVGVSAGYLSSVTNLPQGDNNGFGLVPIGLIGGTVVCSPRTPCGTPGAASFDTTSAGYFNALSPGQLSQLQTPQGVERFTSAVNATYKVPKAEWLTLTGTGGLDVNNRDDQYLQPANLIPGPQNALGQRIRAKYTIGTYTMNGSAQASFTPVRDVTSQTTVGLQYQRDNFSGNTATGFGLAGGTTSLAGTSQQFAVGETNTYTRLFGAIVQQQVAGATACSSPRAFVGTATARSARTSGS
jgi:TonB-dependent SusC/RagA subfamily outer membrane receptor